MPVAIGLQSPILDISTLYLVAICIAALLGLFLIFSWLQERSVRALAWWGAAYLIGGSSIALWALPSPTFSLPAVLPGMLIFSACGMIWNGVRLFHRRRVLPLALLAGSLCWVTLCQLPLVAGSADVRIGIGAVIVAAYTYCIAFELWRERRKSLYSRTAAIVVPMLHAVIFLSPMVMRTFLPHRAAESWVDVFALETMVYAVGAAFIVMLMVKDYHVHIHRHAAATDALTGLLNRRAFLESAWSLCTVQRKRKQPVTLLMFDLDHFKSINDTFGHAVGDDVLRLFASTLRSSMRADDIIARLGGEEFAAIIPADLAATGRVAERVRSAFEITGAVIGENPIGATVSIGAAVSADADEDIDALIARADAALYSAKHAGRNRLHTTEDAEPARHEASRLIAAARAGNAVRLVPKARVVPVAAHRATTRPVKEIAGAGR
ncbi:MAG TPA: GGDEF domain-containing protein [Pseudolabrys sp.]|nr:GGDEF domain-containing protein [Pseudolabrys sp.]